MSSSIDNPLTGPCGEAHKHLQQFMTELASKLPGEPMRDVKRTLVERGTAACAHARLGRVDDMTAELRVMQTLLSQVQASDADAQGVDDLRRLLELSASGIRGH